MKFQLALSLLSGLTFSVIAAPNVLLITADDLNCSSVGSYGCPLDGVTPNLDALARQGMRFEHAHVTIAVCQPSRSSWMTGRYPMNSGGEAFHKLSKVGVPTLPDLLRNGGYDVGILGKLPHSTPYKDFTWDMQFDQFDLGAGRAPAIYAAKAREFVEKAKSQKKPFFLMANSHDPHRPFYGNDPEKWYAKKGPRSGAVKPTKTFTVEEVPVPGFLPDIPQVRLEVSEYFSSVRRCDDTVGALLKVLEDAGEVENTLVIFLSDNGMAFPFAKTNCYLNSTRTPLIVRWPSKIKPSSVEAEQMISGIDLAPTILAAAEITQPDGMDGKSYLEILEGKVEKPRNRVFTQFHQTSARKDFQMRAVQSQRYGYIYNPWANSDIKFRNESMFGRTFKAMNVAAKDDEGISERVDLFLNRIPEEFYDFSVDPDALNNLADNPEYKELVAQYRAELKQWMVENADPELKQFEEFIK